MEEKKMKKKTWGHSDKHEIYYPVYIHIILLQILYNASRFVSHIKRKV